MALHIWLCYLAEKGHAFDALTCPSMVPVSLLMAPLSTFFIIFNSTQTAASAVETERELKALLERSFFCKSISCSILRTFALRKYWGNIFEKTP